jgi:stage 0 sporulation regulatory protein
MSMYPNRAELDEKIDILKNKMIISGLEKGLVHPETIEYSQRLDILIFQSQSMKR